MGNPFIDEGCELYAIDTHVVCSSAVIETVKTIQSTGQEQYIAFVNERLLERKVPVTAHMSRNKLSLLKQTGSRLKPSQKQTSKLASARNDCSLFSRLYIACQTRDGDLDTFFHTKINLIRPHSVTRAAFVLEQNLIYLAALKTK